MSVSLALMLAISPFPNDPTWTLLDEQDRNNVFITYENSNGYDWFPFYSVAFADKSGKLTSMQTYVVNCKALTEAQVYSWMNLKPNGWEIIEEHILKDNVMTFIPLKGKRISIGKKACDLYIDASQKAFATADP